MARYFLVRPHAAAEARERGRLGDPGAVVLDHDAAGRSRGASIRVESRGDAEHPAAAPFAGVVEQIAQQLREIAAVADELGIGCASRARWRNPCCA